MKNKRTKLGFSFAEIMVAVGILSVCVFPIFYLTNTSRKETTRAINFLRAVELANEVLEWASIAKFEELTDINMAAFTGSMTEMSGSAIQTIILPTAEAENEIWKNDNLVVDSLFYSEQYAPLYFYRDVKVEELTGLAGIEPTLLKKITVSVSWSEASRPNNINNPSDRNRNLKTSMLVANDKSLIY
jgi:Tfp pilus assembly protein PilV